MTSPALDTIRTESLGVLASLTTPGERVALLDFPSHQNAGDSLIYMGEMEYFSKLGVKVAYISDIHRHDKKTLREKIGDGTIFLHGGGNFGDRWPEFQQFRDDLVATYHENRIIALPQSMEYQNKEALAQTQKAYESHPNLTLMMREDRSLHEAQRAFQNTEVIFCPDLALGARISQVTKPAQYSAVKLMRMDSERIQREPIKTQTFTPQYDWGLTGLDQKQWKLIRTPGRLASLFPSCSRVLYPALERSYSMQADLNLKAAKQTLAQGEIVITDRLHAAVLGALLGSPVIALDNSYGKISSIFDAYLHRIPNIFYAATTQDAERKYSELRK